MANWCTIESDPGVFTELIHSLGCTDVQLEEIISLDLLPDSIYGLIFLFKWKKDLYVNDLRRGLSNDENPGIYFAKQTVQNACATQAIVGILLNHDELKLGETLQSFKDFTSTLPYDIRGDMIGQQELIEKNTTRSQGTTPLFLQTTKMIKTRKGRSVPLRCFIPKNGSVYELDGMRDGPIAVGSYSETSDWVEVARNEIQRRINEFQSDEINLTLWL